MVATRNNKIIVALDFEDQSQAMALVNTLSPRLCNLKVGITLYTKLGPDFVKLLVTKGFDVFLDLKFHDIPQQVYGACKSAANLGVWMINVHALGGLAMLKKARDAVSQLEGQKPLLIGVTILTSMQQEDIKEIGLNEAVDSTVMRLAGLCKQAGLDGVVCSPHEANAIKQEFGNDFITVTPGIRLADANVHDQKRIMTPQAALNHGADYLVMGRSITEHQAPNELLHSLMQPEV
jgi:orotidine-5'-phosphate decarboxylase